MQKSKAAVINSILYWLCIGILILTTLVPVYWLLITGLKLPREAMADPPVFIPTIFTLRNYEIVFKMPGVVGFIFNSILTASVSTVVGLIFAVMMAYALVRLPLNRNLSGILIVWVLASRMYPPISTAVPYFVLLKQFGLVNSRLGLMITYVGFLVPFCVWLLYGFFKSLPAELDRAALVDGANPWQRLRLVQLPLLAPSIAATAILGFIWAWNEFLFALILTSRQSQTVPVALATFLNERGLEWGPMAALGTIHVLPVLILAFMVQRYLISGLTLGAVKE